LLCTALIMTERRHGMRGSTDAIDALSMTITDVIYTLKVLLKLMFETYYLSFSAYKFVVYRLLL
jgi:hypothetical protein